MLKTNMYVRESPLRVGDKVLSKSEGMNHSEPPLNLEPLIVTAKKCTMIAAKKMGEQSLETGQNSSSLRKAQKTPNIK